MTWLTEISKNVSTQSIPSLTYWTYTFFVQKLLIYMYCFITTFCTLSLLLTRFISIRAVYRLSCLD